MNTLKRIESHHRHPEATKGEGQPIIEVRIMIPNRYTCFSLWLKEFSSYHGLLSKMDCEFGLRCEVLGRCRSSFKVFVCEPFHPFRHLVRRPTERHAFHFSLKACDSWQEWKFHQCSPYSRSHARHVFVLEWDWMCNVRIPMYNGKVVCLTARCFLGLQRLFYFMAQFSQIMQNGSIFG